MSQKWPKKIFPMVNFVFSDDGHFGLGAGGGGATEMSVGGPYSYRTIWLAITVSRSIANGGRCAQPRRTRAAPYSPGPRHALGLRGPSGCIGRLTPVSTRCRGPRAEEPPLCGGSDFVVRQ